MNQELLWQWETKRRKVRGTNRERRALLVAIHRMSASTRAAVDIPAERQVAFIARFACHSSLPQIPDRIGFRITVLESAQRSLLVATRVLARSPKVTLYTEGFDRFVTSTATPIATGWSDSCRVGPLPTGKAHVFTAYGHRGYGDK
jgi:hypothetical protein